MALSACQYCGRQNEAGAPFCSDCGKPLTQAAAARSAVAAGGGGSGVVSRTSGPPSPGGAPADATCPLCVSIVNPHGTAGGGTGGGSAGGGVLDRRLILFRRSGHPRKLLFFPTRRPT